jgi:hypothetical protein
VHVTVPGLLAYVPLAHAVQVLIATAPVVVELLPAGQRVQAPCPMVPR